MIKHGVAPFLECSSKGDNRFSAFYAKVKIHNNKSIEELYQAIKEFKDGSKGLTWKQAKGRKPKNLIYCQRYYTYLWERYIWENPELIEVLTNAIGLSDVFGQKGHCCQATELWNIRNSHTPTQGKLL